MSQILVTRFQTLVKTLVQTKVKTFAKNLLTVRPENVTRRKRKKTRTAIAKLFALNANPMILKTRIKI